MSHQHTADVVIVGAGAAGLACAAQIIRRSARRVLVLEARDCIGGRCDTRFHPELPAPMELGAEFIHGASRPVLSLLKKSGGTVVQAKQSRWTGAAGNLSPRADLLPEITRAMRKFAATLKRDIPFEEFLVHTLGQALPSAAIAQARLRVQGYDAADPLRISAREVVTEWTSGGGADGVVSRPAGGYHALLRFLADQLTAPRARVQLATQVKTVTWRRGNVEIGGLVHGRPFRANARQAVITLPVGVLKQPQRAAGAVRFMPALAQKRAALKHIDAGAVVKLVLRFRHAFWETLGEGRYRDAAFLRSPHPAFATFWTTFPLRAPLLVAWCGGPPAARLSTQPAATMIDLALQSLESLFGHHAGIREQFLGCDLHDWLNDPYCLGAYSSLAAGGQGAREQLAKPLRETLFFAGEATDLAGESATVGGALRSGVRAAREVIAS
ncbi:MAG: FAD-dependent oxidoreductase [Betaproteobacteria bacterium]|nr:FAD-dependent oxidoreductase [Betaproteobacteria bacterium]